MAGTAGYDGSVRIDTRVDTKGFNDGTKKLEKQTETLGRKILSRFKSVGKSIASVFKSALGVVTGILGIISVGILFGNELLEKLTRGVDKTSKYSALIQQMKGAFDQLKGAIFSVFATLLQAAMPVLIKVINWLTTMLDKLNMILAAWFGQKTVMRAVVKSTQDQKKALEGSLAAFDQINVLQQKQGEGAGEAPDTNPITFEEVPVTQEAIDLVSKVKSKWQDFVTEGKQLWQDFLEFIHWDEIAKAGSEAWEFISTAFSNAWTRVKEIWNSFGLSQMFESFWSNAKENFKKLLANAIETFLGVRDGVKRVFEGITEFFEGVLQGDWKKVWDGLKDIVGGVLEIIATIVVGTVKHFIIVFQGWIKDIKVILTVLEKVFRTVFDTVTRVAGAFAKGIANLIIEAVNAMIRVLVSGINTVINALNSLSVTVPDWIPVFGGQTWSVNIQPLEAPQIPRLATGAVIPPNAEFAAILGDQKNGRNLEAPEGLIRQIIREEMQGSNSEVSVTIPLILDGEKIYQNHKRIQMRHGRSLITGGAAS